MTTVCEYVALQKIKKIKRMAGCVITVDKTPGCFFDPFEAKNSHNVF